MKTKSKLTKAFLLTVLIFALAANTFCLFSCSEKYAGEEILLPKEELLSRIDNKEDLGFEFASEYLDEWGFPRFSISKFKTLERCYSKYYVEDMDPPISRAEKTARYFLDCYYDKVDVSLTSKTTDELLTSYVETIGDKYSIYRTKEEYDSYSTNMTGSFVGIGISVLRGLVDGKIEIVEVTPGGGAEEAGLLVGDMIIEINGKQASDVGFDAATSEIRGKEGSTVNITILRNGDKISFTVTRKKIVESSVSYEFIDDFIYIKITGFKSNTYSQFKEAIDAAEEEGVSGIIYDLRGNPGGYLSSVVDMLDYIAPKGTEIVSFKNSYNSTMYAESSHTVTLPTVVICDKNTASAAELFTASIRDFCKMGFFRASVVGEVSFGKGIMQDTYKFSDGSSITMTVDYYNPPLGENYHGVGINPDVIIEEKDKDGLWLDFAIGELAKLVG